MGSLVNMPDSKSIGIALSPVHFYQKGSLHKVEQACIKLLANAQLNTDYRFALAFTGRNDERERRTVCQPGIIALPLDSDHFNIGDAFWRSTPVFKNGLHGG